MSLFDNNLIKQKTPIESLQLKTRKWIRAQFKSASSSWVSVHNFDWDTAIPIITKNLNDRIPYDIWRALESFDMYHPCITGCYMGGNKIECSVFCLTGGYFTSRPAIQFDKFYFTIHTVIEDYVDNEHI